jgi:endo-1,4-beta-mannosidase
MAEYRFVGINTPNLHRIETNSSDSTLTAIPTASEIWDLLCGVQQMGARVARLYVISFCDDGTCHVSNASAVPFNASSGASAPALSFNEEWFLALDTAIYTADQLGVRLIIPFINMIELQQWGGAASLARWAGVQASHFFEHAVTKKLYKRVVWFVLSRKNHLTGRYYRDEPAIFGWELGNELFAPLCDDLKPPHCGSQRSLRDFPEVPVEWTREMAGFIKSIDGNHLVVAGGYVKSGNALTVADVDMVGGTYYSADTAVLQEDIAVVRGQIPFIVKEFGLAGDSNVTTVETVVGLLNSSRAVAGGLYWSFR